MVEGHLGVGARAAALAGIDGLTHSTGVRRDTVRPEALEKVPSMRIFDAGRQGPNPDLSEYWLFIEDPPPDAAGDDGPRDGQDLIKLLIEKQVFIESEFI